ncbi:MAG: hypothetical protein AVDCRST_MAG11-2797, partial [uncultured Gemmatimonadaceae bacterium]
AGHADPRGRGVSAGHHGGPAADVPGARAPGAEHPGLPPPLDARRARAPRAESALPRDRLPRPPAAARRLGGAAGAARRGARPAERAAHGRRQQPVRRRAAAHRGRRPGVGRHARPRARARGRRLPGRGARVGGEGGGAARGRRGRGRRGRRRDLQGARALHQEGRRQPAAHRRPGARPGVGRLRAAPAPGVHPHRRPAGVLAADRLPQRAVARARALPAPALRARRGAELRAAHDRARQPPAPPPPHHVRDRAHGVARERPRAPRAAHGRAAERAHRGGRGAVRHRAAAARRARLLRALPGPHPLREGLLPAGGVSVLLARVRDARRLLRLLPRLPRVLEALRHRPARRGAEEGVLRERPAPHEPAAAGRVAAV